MKRIYLLKRLCYKFGYVLNANVPYPARFDTDRDLWLIDMDGGTVLLPVISKFVGKVVDMAPVLV